MNDRIYLDHNATTPLDPEVREAMRPFLSERFGNPSSIYQEGMDARYGVEKARMQVAELLGCEEEEVIFTGGGSESDNAAIFGTLRALRERGRHIITSQIEHPAVLRTCQYLEKYEGYKVDYLPVDRDGRVGVEDVAAALRPDTALVTIMLANNETGAIQPIRELCARAHEQGVRFHTDAVQAAGKVPLSVGELGVELLSLSAHKFHGPKGMGVLYCKRGTELFPLIFGGGQERGLRAGTENVAGIVGTGHAAMLARRRLAEDAARLGELRDLLENQLLQRVPGARVLAGGAHRLPNTSLMTFANVPGVELVAEIDGLGVCASSGSACSAGTTKVSHVLSAMGVSRAEGLSAVRFSLGRDNTRQEIERAAAVVAECVERMRLEARPSGR
ncbi:cysteine desulfurase [bacterium]|nr:cysteine desulfurase [bacterium]